MSETNVDSEPPRKRSPAPSSGPGTGMSSEMRRQMEAAKERMKRFHAVYGQAAHGFDADPAAEAPTRSEER